MKKKRSARVKVLLILSMVLVCIFSNQVYTGLVEAGNALSWERWYKSMSNYLDAMTAIINKGKQIAMRQDSRLSKAMQEDDRELGKGVVAETGKTLSAIIVELLELKPPQDLREYHQKVLDAYKYREMANDVMLRDNLDDYYMYINTAIISEIESIEELMRVYNNHGAPAELIDALHTITQALKEELT